jgi:hypothetical protein
MPSRSVCREALTPAHHRRARGSARLFPSELHACAARLSRHHARRQSATRRRSLPPRARRMLTTIPIAAAAYLRAGPGRTPLPLYVEVADAHAHRALRPSAPAMQARLRPASR